MFRETVRKIVRWCDLAYDLQQTLYGHWLAERSLRMPLSALQRADENAVPDIIRYASEIGDVSRKSFRITKTEIVGRKSIKKEIPPYLFEQLTLLVSPPAYPPPQSREEIVRSIDQPPDVARERAFVRRYETQESYSAIALRLFDVLIKKLCALESAPPPLSDQPVLTSFCRSAQEHSYFWEVFVGDLVHGKLQAGDSAEGRYPLPHALKCALLWIETCTKVPALIHACDNTFTVSHAFAQNQTVLLPYLAARMQFPYLSDFSRNTLLYSCLACKNP